MQENGRSTDVKPNKEWTSQRFSMFIHWGLYSQLGGVWDGKPVEWGYSEQIQSFAGIFSDYYAATAEKFTAEKWNADSIVALAKAAQMQSIVMTAKHHDGFSMYATRYSSYNVADATPFARDPLRELSVACKKGGLRFGVYFSLIDWHFPQAYPISSHNADPITPEHHKHNMNQVRELLTNYGPVSEIWFDMGSLTREQSRELYNLVTDLQPNCMVSGRLGNDFGDFAVMADNAVPAYHIGIPWQTAGSFFKETWSYRSWQKREDLQSKIAEKITTLKNVVAHGGNYLLNIGPRGDGSVVEFERDVLLAMGQWLRDSSEVIYKQTNGNQDKTTPGPVTGETLDHSNALPIYGYSCFDYYSSFRSIIGYEWNFIGKKSTPYLLYHAADAAKELIVTYNGKQYPVTLSPVTEVAPNNVITKSNHPVTISHSFILRKGRNSFAEQFIDTNALKAITAGIYTKTDLRTAQELGWQSIQNMGDRESIIYREPAKWKSNIWIAHIIDTQENSQVLAKIGGNNDSGIADAVEIWLNGKQLFKKGYTNTRPTAEYINLPLVKGQNYLIVKMHNRFENNLTCSFTTNIPQQWYRQPLPFAITKKEIPQKMIITAKEQRGGADVGLRDLSMILL